MGAGELVHLHPLDVPALIDISQPFQILTLTTDPTVYRTPRR
jgi:hypothetical protein